MGAASSVEMVGTDDDIVTRLLPLYYIANAVVSDADIELCKSSWDSVLKGKSQVFEDMKGKGIDGLPISCISWFHDRYPSQQSRIIYIVLTYVIIF